MKKLLSLALVLASIHVFGAGVPYIFNLNGTGSNTVFQAGTNKITLTNFVSGPETLPELDFAIGTGTGGRITFSANPGDLAYANIYMDPIHGVNAGQPGSSGASELQVTTAHNMAFGVGQGFPFGWFQWGIGGNQYATNVINPYFTNNGDMLPGDIGQGSLHYQHSAVSNVRTQSYSGSFTFKTQAQLGANLITFYPGIYGHYLSAATNANAPWGTFALRLVRDIGNTPQHADTQATGKWDPTLITPGIDVYGGNYAAEKFWGGVVQHKAYGYATTNTIIDLASAQVYDYICATTNVTLSTSNGLANLVDNTSAGRVTVLLRSMGVTGQVFMTWPQWCTNSGVSMPASFPGTNILRLELEWTGIGETNVNVVSVQTNKDSSFYWDQNALSFLGQSGQGLLTSTASNAINNYVIMLKTWTGGPWFSASNLYPFIATTASSNLFNLINTNNYRLVNHGTISPTVLGANFDGVSGTYYDTGFHQTAANSSNAAMFVWIKTNYNNAGACVMGVRTDSTTSESRISCSGTPLTFRMTINDASNLGYEFLGTNGLCASRIFTTYHGVWIERGNVTDYSASPAKTSPSDNVFIGDFNVNGNPQGNNWKGLIQVAGCFGGLSLTQYKTLYDATACLNIALYR